MCLTTFDSNVYTAEADIEVYKCLDYPTPSKNLIKRLFFPKHPRSSIVGHEYKKGVLQEKATLNPKGVYLTNELTVDEGYHSDTCWHYSNATFVIPKGTRYMKGWYNDDRSRINYVSETIVYKGKLKRKR